MYERQWLQSVRSIRQYNQQIPLYFFHYGPPSATVLAEVARQNIVLRQSDFATFLAEMPPQTAQVLLQNPCVQKFAPLRELAESSVLYIDCDTYFYADPNLLFDRYTECEFYARAEPNTWRSLGPEAQGGCFAEADRWRQPISQLDNFMRELTDASGWSPFPPYNLGVALFNHGAAAVISASTNQFLNNLYQFMCDIHRRDPQRYRGAVGPTLPYPPFEMCDPWLSDQVANWYTWARLGLTHGMIRDTDVTMGVGGSELERGVHPIIAHYYHLCEDDFFARFGSRL